MRFRNVATFKILAALLFNSPASAAELNKDPATDWIVNLSGEIKYGDADKLIQRIKNAKPPIIHLNLDSPGGSVDEALRLARVVERAALTTGTEGVCASACFFVWLSGVSRQGNGSEVMSMPEVQAKIRADGMRPGYIGLHRPFLPNLQASPNKLQEKIMLGVAQYLDRKLVPRRLTDAMMSRPSNDIYWLKQADLFELGRYSPSVEEYMIKKCGYDRNSYAKRRSAHDASLDSASATSDETIRRSIKCETDEILHLQRRGIEAIENGYHP